jgi:hypothetical protein
MTSFRALTALSASLVLLTGCPGPATVKLEPIPRPPGVVARVDAEVELTAQALNGGTLVASLFKAGTTERIANASFSLIGPTLGSGEIQRGTDIAFYPLIPGSYALRVSAPGYVPLVDREIAFTVKTKEDGTTELEPKLIERRLELTPEAGTVTGTVTSGGKPLWGARVLMGESWTFTGQDGSFKLTGVAGSGTLKVRKGGYHGQDRLVTVSGETRTDAFSLAERGGKRRVELVNAGQHFAGGTTVGDILGSLLQDASITTMGPGPVDVRLLASPKVTPDIAETQAFVRAGGTLIMTGEWGGFGDYDPAALNALARPFGLAVRPDLVRIAGQTTQSETISATVNPALPASRDASSVKLFTSSSVMATPMAVTLADSGASGYRVQAASAGAQTLAAAVPYGDGLVVLVGDTSAWAGSHLNEPGNRQFMLNLFGW